MKKLITISILAASFAATSAFSQGYFKFSSGKSEVYDGFTGSAATTAATVDVALLWAPASTASPMAISSTPILGNATTSEPYTDAQAWSAILNGTFTLAQSTAIGGTVMGTTLANGSISFNGGGSFDITGTTTSTAYTLMLLSWNSSFATPALAAAAHAAIGWSAPLQYTSGTSAIDNSISSAGFGQFGTFIPSVPEPTTIALAGLGGLSLLLARRKK